MSHFAVMVVTKELPTQEILIETLMPWHEFECTGYNNKYVVDVDETKEAMKAYKHYEGGSEYKTFLDFVEHFYGKKPVAYGKKPDTEGEHKYGYYLLNKKGEVTKVIDRTNPNRKWDWFQVGGRYSGRLRSKAKAAVGGGPFHDRPQGSDQCQIKDLDMEAMRKASVERYKGWLNETIKEDRWIDTIRCKVSKETLLEIWAAYVPHAGEKHRLFDEYLKSADRSASKGWFDAYLLANYPEEPVTPAFIRAYKAGLVNSIVSGWDDIVDDKDPTSADPFAWIEKNVKAISALAVVADGQWYGKGDMGWFGMMSNKDADWETKFEELFKNLNPEHYISIVDCHI